MSDPVPSGDEPAKYVRIPASTLLINLVCSLRETKQSQWGAIASTAVLDPQFRGQLAAALAEPDVTVAAWSAFNAAATALTRLHDSGVDIKVSSQFLAALSEEQIDGEFLRLVRASQWC